MENLKKSGDDLKLKWIKNARTFKSIILPVLIHL